MPLNGFPFHCDAQGMPVNLGARQRQVRAQAVDERRGTFLKSSVALASAACLRMAPELTF